MFIKCSECGTSYNIPDSEIGARPRKMRCARCKTVFAISRRDKSIPDGYIPIKDKRQVESSDFIYLKQSSQKLSRATLAIIESSQSMPAQDPTMVGYSQVRKLDGYDPEEKVDTYPSDMAVPDNKIPDGPSADSSPSPKSAANPSHDRVVEEVLKKAKAKELISAKPTQGKPAPVQEKPAPQEPIAEEIPLVTKKEEDSVRGIFSEIEQSPPKPPGTPGTSRRTPLPDIYGGSAWEYQVPLDLADFSVEEPRNPSQLLGKIITIFIVAVILFCVFVSYRNNWNMSASDFHNQIAFAFSGEEIERLPDEVQGLEVIVEDRQLILRDNNGPVLAVYGKIFNNTGLPRTHVVLRGRLIDGDGKIRSQLRIPCGKVLEEAAIETMDDDFSWHYKKDGILHNCNISRLSNALYQILFDKIPVDYNDKYKVDVKVISARSPD